MSSNAKTDPRHDFLPARDADLLNWSRNFDQQINTPPGPGAFGISALQAAQYTVLHDAFAAGYANATNANLNSKAAIGAKNSAKKALKAEARKLARIVQATPSVTNDQRGKLGLTIADPHMTAIARPADPPIVSVLRSLGCIVRIRLRDKSSPDRLGRPPGTAGAVIMSYTAQPQGEPREMKAPANMANWTFRGIATRRYFDVNFDADVPAGAKVWITAMWFNTRGQLSTPSTPQAVRVGEGVAMLRMAA